MDLLVVRHAVAEDRDEFAATGRPDTARPLTADGRKKFERGARGLVRVLPALDVLASSALRRAVETAEILARAYRVEGGPRLRELEPGARPEALVRWLRRQNRQAVVAVVGHEPHLSALAAHLLAGRGRGFTDFKKGGAALLALGDEPAAGEAELRWLLTAAQLRRLGR